MIKRRRYTRDGVEGDLMSKTVEFIDDGVVGVEVGEEEGHGDAAVVGVEQILEPEVEVVVGDGYGVVETQDDKLWHLIKV